MFLTEGFRGNVISTGGLACTEGLACPEASSIWVTDARIMLLSTVALYVRNLWLPWKQQANAVPVFLIDVIRVMT